MKLIDIVNNIDKSKNNECWIDITDFSGELNYNFDYYSEPERFKCYWIGNWCCTDTWVGYRVYFLDDEPVCFSIQKARKSDEMFRWVSQELAIKVRNYLISLMAEQEDELSLQMCDINEDIGDSYKINFNNQVINWKTAVLNSEPVEFVERIRQSPDWGIDTAVKIQTSSGEEKVVNIKELDFKFNLK